MRQKTIYALAAAVSSVGLGIISQPNQAKAATVTLAITASGGDWTAYALDSTGDNAGITLYNLDVIGTGGLTVTTSFEDAPEGTTGVVNGKKTTNYTTGFNSSFDSNGDGDVGSGGNGIEIYALQSTSYGSTNNATADSLVIQGFGQTTGSADGASWTQIPGLGVDVASGTYSGTSGILTVSAVPNGPEFQIDVLENTGSSGPWTGPGNVTSANVVAGSVVVAGVVGHPIISLTAATAGAPSNYGTQITNGTGTQQGAFSTGTNVLTVTGGNGSYKFAQVTGISSGSGTATGYVEANGFNTPPTDQEIYALDVNLTSGTLAELAADINASNTADDATLASTTMAHDPFPAAYNLFLTFPEGDVPSADNFLGIDLTQAGDVSGDVVAIAVVPEPMSLGLLALGGIGMLARRRRSSSPA